MNAEHLRLRYRIAVLRIELRHLVADTRRIRAEAQALLQRARDGRGEPAASSSDESAAGCDPSPSSTDRR